MWWDLVAGAWRSLRAHALRFTLTSMGIVWGTAMLTVLMAYTDGYDRHFQRQIDKVGPRIVWSFPGVVVKERVGERGSRPVELENEDAERLAALAAVEHAAPNLWVGLQVHRADRVTKLLWTYGVTGATREIRSFQVAEGRFLNDDDVEHAARSLFLGAEAARRLFGRRRALGETVHVGGTPFRVVGVARAKGDQIVNMGPNDDELSLIPITTAQRRFTRDDSVGVVIFSPTTRERSEAARRGARSLLGLHHDFAPHDERAISFFDIQEAVAIIDALGLGVTLFLTSAGLITLAVGAVGVMNIMLVVVTERTREVGLRKAIGASDAAVFAQFLLETVMVTVVAGSLGGVLGWLAVEWMAAFVPEDSALAPSPYLEPATVVVIAGVLVGVGIASGVIPARRAARIDPAISLRSL